MLKVGSDFSGVGAFNQALIRLGVEFIDVYACDMDKYARQTYIHNYGEPPYYPMNVYDRAIPKESLDIYMTSPPCQAFSIAGNRQGKDDKRGILFFNSLEFIQQNKPRYFIFENVKGLLSDDNGKTFSEWVNLLGGKSVNGNSILFPYDESVPYHLYWQVLNAKEHGIPQNRERVFLVGIRDDSDNTFRFPIEEYLTKRLKDILEDNVDQKYFVTDEKIEYIKRSYDAGWGKKNIINDQKGISYCIDASYYKGSRSATIVKTEQNRIISNEEKNDVIIHEIPEMVKVRKYDVDIPKLQQCLKSHKNKSIKAIADELNVPKTEVEHWFRTDKFFGIPNAQIWFDLKKCINITTSEFDESITEYITKDAVFEKTNRVYDDNGIAPTMTSTSADERILVNEIKVGTWRTHDDGRGFREIEDGNCPTIQARAREDGSGQPVIMNNYNIRRLTPRECFRLMDFPDSFTWICSDSQAYKQAGNSIVVNVLYKIIKNLNLS